MKVIKSMVYDNIVVELKVKISEEIDKNNVKNCRKAIKSNFSKCYDFLKNGLKVDLLRTLPPSFGV